jgi:hypothetical protein
MFCLAHAQEIDYCLKQKTEILKGLLCVTMILTVGAEIIIFIRQALAKVTGILVVVSPDMVVWITASIAPMEVERHGIAVAVMIHQGRS